MDDDQIKEESKNIVNIYEHNVRAINSIAQKNNIKTQFYWQPSIFTVSTKTLPDEYRELISQNPVVAKIFIATSEEIARRPNLRNVVNLSTAFDKADLKGGFYDPVHVTGTLNQFLANAICKRYK